MSDYLKEITIVKNGIPKKFLIPNHTEEIAAIKESLANKAEANHEHTGYANANHEHDFYTKEEIDEKIAAMQNESGGGNVDLSNYCTKSEAQNDFAPRTHTHTEFARLNHTHTGFAPTVHTHPDYANKNHTHTEYANKEHTHPDYALKNHNHNETYYTKEEVDQKVADVQSSEAVDLSNYYNKQETYNKTEIDEKVAGMNSGDGGGNEGMTAHLENHLMHVPYVVGNGTANNYTAAINGITGYVEGMAMALKIPVANTGAATVNVNNLGAKKIKKSNGNDMKSGDLKANSIYTLRFDGSVFILQGEGGEYGTATAAQVLSGYTIGTNNGIVTGTYTPPAAAQYGTATAAQVLQGYTIGTADGVVNGTIPILPGDTIIPSKTNQIKRSGYYGSDIVVRGDRNLDAKNIRSGTRIFGVSGKYSAEFRSETLYKTANAYMFSSGDRFVNYEEKFTFSFSPKVVVVRVYITSGFARWTLDSRVLFTAGTNGLTLKQNGYLKDTTNNYAFLIENAGVNGKKSELNGYILTLRLQVQKTDADGAYLSAPSAYLEVDAYGILYGVF